MKTFTIENETNNISIHISAKEAEAVPNSERFSSESGLAKLAANWPPARLVEIWNRLPGASPIKKFKDRATAVSRIWKAIQRLGGTVEAETQLEIAPMIESLQEVEAITATAHVPAAETTPPETEGEPLVTEQAISESREADVTTAVAPQTPDVAPARAAAKKKATRAKKAPVAATEKKTREGSKTEAILELMKQPGGTTLKAIMEATNWQAHSVRGFISGTLGKRMGLTVVSAKADNGERRYAIGA